MQAQIATLGRIISYDNDRGPLTLKAAVAKRGLKDPKPKSAKYYNALACRSTATPNRKFPDPVKLQHQILIERQSPLFYFDSPDCIGDMPQFSSRGLTNWYVGEFCRLNHLRG